MVGKPDSCFLFVLDDRYFISNEKKKEVKNVAVWGCLIISYDCGTKGISCGETLSEIIEQALNGYDFMCSDVEP